MSILVFDIETVPDTESGRRLYDLAGLPERDVAEAMIARRRRDSDGATDFIRHHLHRVVAIAVVLAEGERINLWSLGQPDSTEAELVGRFFEGIEKYSPQLVSWNGRGFDLPVLHYRALLHGIQAPRYWETGGEDQAFRWNNYLNRFHERHTDLMDVLAGYELRAAAPLNEVAVMLGFPGKLGMQGSEVSEQFLAGNIDAIRRYCETDVLNTYLIYLRFQFMRGRLSEKGYEEQCARLRTALNGQDQPHLREFLDAWRQ